MVPSAFFQIPLGSVIYAKRTLYRHYGVYVGDGRVVHFAAKKGFETDAENAFIQMTSLDEFAKGDEIEVEPDYEGALGGKETAERAMACVGEGKGEYNLVFNNCEHFANWCKYGEKSSSQVRTAVAATAVAVGVGAIITAVASALASDKSDRD